MIYIYIYQNIFLFKQYGAYLYQFEFVCVVQVVKLLLQYGSDVTDRDLGGVAAAEMANEPSIKELLQGSTLMQQHHCEFSELQGAQKSLRAVLISLGLALQMALMEMAFPPH